jgi:hypothetical protein
MTTAITTQPRNPRKTAVTLAVIFLGVGGIIAVCLYQIVKLDPPERSTADSRLTVPRDRLDFGEVWEDSHFRWTLPIENHNAHDVEIQDLVASCTCMALEPRALTIPAGETREVHLTLDLTARRSQLPESEWRDFEVTIAPRLVGDPEKTIKTAWNLRGKVHTPIYFEQPFLDLGRQSEASQPLPPQTAIVRTFVPLQDLIAERKSAGHVAVNRLSDDPGCFKLTFSPSNLPIGQVKFQVSVVPRLSEGRLLPAKSLPVIGWIVNDFQASPPDVLFGARRLGESAKDTISLYSLTNQHFDVAAIHVDGDGLIVAKGPEGSAEGPFFAISQRISKRGQQSSRIVFALRSSEKKHVDVVVGVSYHGIQPTDK